MVAAMAAFAVAALAAGSIPYQSRLCAVVAPLAERGGGFVFMTTLARLFRPAPAPRPAPPLPYPEHAAVDAIATRFMRLAGIWLLVGLVVGVFTAGWRPGVGRWDLVWAHAMLVGFMLSMVAGVCYHVLARWTGRRWRGVAPIRLHYALVAVGLPVMILALATDEVALFAIAGPIQAAAIGIFLITIAPLTTGLPALSRAAVLTAMGLLVVGVSLGASFAIEPILGVWLRVVHAEINLFGWTGLLISGVGYYFLPRLAGQPLRWPWLAPYQIAAIVAGVGLSVTAIGWRAHANGPDALMLVAGGLIAAGFLLFGLQVAGIFHHTSVGTVATLPYVPKSGSPVGVSR
jgi:hypothetical protein